jgi:hypothetical protein
MRDLVQDCVLYIFFTVDQHERLAQVDSAFAIAAQPDVPSTMIEFEVPVFRRTKVDVVSQTVLRHQ